jgi:hypothetical protein
VARPPPGWIKRRGAPIERIDLQDTPAKAVFKLVQGDRAAAEACIAMVKAVAGADPQAEFGPFTPLVILEATGLVGPVIGTLFSRVCGGDPVTALAVLHAARLKLVSPAALRAAAEGKAPVDAAALLDLVRRQVPGFGR